MISYTQMEGIEVPTGVENGTAKQLVETYRVGDANVRIGWVETSPKNPEGLNSNKAVIFFGAWNWDPDLPIMTSISQKIADGFGQTVFDIDSKTNKIGADTNKIEAEGAAQFIAAHDFSEITIVGHSEGGIKAVNLAVILERNNPAVKIDGVVLMDSMGIYSRDVQDLSIKFIMDPIKVAPKEYKDTGVTPPEGGAKQLLTGIYRDMRYFGLRYPKELTRQLRNMATLNPNLQQIKAPVLVMTAERDFVSDYRGYLPEEEINKRVEGSSDEQLNSWLEKQFKWEDLPKERQAKYGNEASFHLKLVKSYRKHEEMFKRGKARGQYLKENTLPGAENIAMIVISKGAHHSGLTDIRTSQAAKVASRMFERMRRKAA